MRPKWQSDKTVPARGTGGFWGQWPLLNFIMTRFENRGIFERTLIQSNSVTMSGAAVGGRRRRLGLFFWPAKIGGLGCYLRREKEVVTYLVFGAVLAAMLSVPFVAMSSTAARPTRSENLFPAASTQCISARDHLLWTLSRFLGQQETTHANLVPLFDPDQ
jgi:hypothetical protein